jgi:membrane protease YdiL (CAAX protease family)
MEEQPNIPGGIEESVRGRDLLIGVPILWGVELLLGVSLVLWAGPRLSLEDHPMALLVVTLASGATTFLVTWFLVCRKYRKSFSDGFLISRPTKKTLLVAVLIGVVLALAGGAVASAFSTGKHLFLQISSTTTGLASLATMFLLLPPVEEFYYRGFIYPVLEKQFGALPATLAVIIWFTAAHAMQSTGDWIAIPVVCVAGTIWTVQRRLTGSLTASLVTHWMYNFCLLVIGLATRGGD